MINTKQLKKNLPTGFTRVTFIIKKEFYEKIKAIAYWERITIKEVIHEALAPLFTQDRNVKPVHKKKLI